ncbi:hypothetical protein Tco_1392041 [Tanacetum coccineum]
MVPGALKVIQTTNNRYDVMFDLLRDEIYDVVMCSTVTIFEDPSIELYQIPSKEDLDDFFGSLYKEYFEGRKPNVSTSNNSAGPDTHHDTYSPTTIIVDAEEAPHIVSTSIKQTPPQSNEVAEG